MDTSNQIKVWDLFIRVFHWTLVLAFTIAYTTDDDLELLHTWSGYLIVALLVMRIVWGFVASEHARFNDFVTSLAVAKDYFKQTLRHKARRYIGHNPAGGWMVLLLIIGLLITCFSSIVLYTVEDQAGPLGSTVLGGYKHWEDFFEGLHEAFANLTRLLVFLLIGGVVVESLIHRENLVRAMWYGYKRSPHP